MFNVTVTSKEYETLKAYLEYEQTEVTQEVTWHDKGIKYIDALIGKEYEELDMILVTNVANILGRYE